MTVHVVGHWDIGYHAPITEQYFWSFPLRTFAVDEWHMTPHSGIINRERDIPLTEWHQMGDYFDAHPELTRVFFEARTKHQNPNTTWLHEFQHPDDCVYVFGCAHFNPSLRWRREQDVVVSIKTPADKALMWGEQAMCIALYDRQVKSWQ